MQPKAIRISAIQLQYKKNNSCIVVVLHLCGPLKQFSFTYITLVPHNGFTATVMTATDRGHDRATDTVVTVHGVAINP